MKESLPLVDEAQEGYKWLSREEEGDEYESWICRLLPDDVVATKSHLFRLNHLRKTTTHERRLIQMMNQKNLIIYLGQKYLHNGLTMEPATLMKWIITNHWLKEEYHVASTVRLSRVLQVGHHFRIAVAGRSLLNIVKLNCSMTGWKATPCSLSCGERPLELVLILLPIISFPFRFEIDDIEGFVQYLL